MTDHIDIRYREVLYCRCCGATADADDWDEGVFTVSHAVPGGEPGAAGKVCNDAYRNDPTTRWNDLWP